jgi:hypothetical protein
MKSVTYKAIESAPNDNTSDKLIFLHYQLFPLRTLRLCENLKKRTGNYFSYATIIGIVFNYKSSPQKTVTRKQVYCDLK